MTGSSTRELFDDTERLLDILISRATGGVPDDSAYRRIRSKLLAEPRVKSKLPSCVQKCRDLGAFWSFIKREFTTYEDRRYYLRNEFDTALTALEHELTSPPGDAIAVSLAKLDSEHVGDAWRKALERKDNDPEGAITAARTLVESVCKHILDDLGMTYEDSDDLPKLYGLASAHLNLSPAQHTEQIFKQILGGCKSVVEGLGALRNKVSDAHGKGKKSIKPASRHAELAVNLAGSMATYLVSTWEAHKGQSA